MLKDKVRDRDRGTTTKNEGFLAVENSQKLKLIQNRHQGRASL